MEKFIQKLAYVVIILVIVLIASLVILALVDIWRAIA
jgi:hypothetical protein